MIKTCIINQKGGVGKSTTTVSLSAALAEAGKKTLVVDLCSQGQSTAWLGVDDTRGRIDFTP